ncbi:YafY family protein [Agrobacterium tumefaciens]|uniref:helix-turn-helix transcriptional regulator n=1 Tax=Agrobacterium tumefaciens TaxID=358 RepID=UPI00287F1BB0|nr:YafY family protein [Agrobacterium tumefaciens]MDS7596301.1 YafY family transcriptional regulator [Agrobacterium tumefaciens]
MSRTGRLFEMLSVLRARRSPVTAIELARELGVSQRSVYRDIETLRLLGAPLDGQAGVGFRLKEGFFLPHLAFSPDELDALILGLEWVQQRADPALVRSAEAALAKVLSARSASTLLGAESPRSLIAATASERTDPPHVAPMRDAIRRQRKVSIEYMDAQGTVSSRTIWPIAVVYFDDVRIVAAWCENRAAFRHFRVDRVRGTTLLEERYPERRHSLMKRWRDQDRDWRSFMTVSDVEVR